MKRIISLVYLCISVIKGNDFYDRAKLDFEFDHIK